MASALRGVLPVSHGQDSSYVRGWKVWLFVPEALLVDLAEARRIIGIDDGAARGVAVVEVGIVQQIGVKEDHLTRAQRGWHNLFRVNARRVYRKARARFEGINLLVGVAAWNYLQTAIRHVCIVEVDKAGDEFIRMRAPTAIPILMPWIG